MLKDNIYACGTIHSNRKQFPQEFQLYIKKGFKERGDYKLLQYENLVITVWQDTKVVSVLSTNSQPSEVTQVSRKQKNGQKQIIKSPKLIANYNEHMGGVDHNDQLRQYYHIRARGHKYYKYLFYFILDVIITNTFIFQKFLKEGVFNTIKDFRLHLASQLIGCYISRKRTGRPPLSLPPKKFCQQHFPRKHDGCRHKCYYCYNYLKIRKDTQWYCNECQMYLCHTGKSDDCYITYHTLYGPTQL